MVDISGLFVRNDDQRWGEKEEGKMTQGVGFGGQRRVSGGWFSVTR